jgi:hypothetical protein
MLYENMIVVEVMKFFLNGGERPDLSFYRDSNGNEVDMTIPRAQECIPLEIKSAATVSQEFFRGFAAFRSAIEKTGDPILVYAGSDARIQNGVRITNLQTLNDALKKLAKSR